MLHILVNGYQDMQVHVFKDFLESAVHTPIFISIVLIFVQ